MRTDRHEAFRPDFYLPEQNLYLEVTVMKQSLVTRKNRKLRSFSELYPNVKRQALLQPRHRARWRSDIDCADVEPAESSERPRSGTCISRAEEIAPA